MYDEEAVKARDAKAVAVLQGHQDRVNKAMDNIYNWLGEEDRSSAEQFLGGFVGSFYATYDTITNPEEVVALAYHVAANPIGTMAGIFKNAVAGNSKQTLYYIKTKNYRALGQEIGYSAGRLAQIALARAAIKKCGELANKRGGETQLPPRGDRGAESKVLSASEAEEYAFNAIKGADKAESVVLGKYIKDSQASYDAVAKDIGDGTFYAQEIQYLIDNGYRFIQEGDLWHAVIK